MCPICLTNTGEHKTLECGHEFCKKCIDEWTRRSSTCPCCRNLIINDYDTLLFSKLVKALVHNCIELNYIVWTIFGNLEPKDTPDIQQYIKAILAITGLTRNQLKTMDPTELCPAPKLVEVCKHFGIMRLKVKNIEKWPNLAMLRPRALLNTLREKASELLEKNDEEFMDLLNSEIVNYL